MPHLNKEDSALLVVFYWHPFKGSFFKGSGKEKVDLLAES